MSVIQSDSRKNTMKRSPITTTVSIDAPSTTAYVLLKVTNVTIPHGVTGLAAGQAPTFRYYYEPFKDGIIWPPLTSRDIGRAKNPIAAGYGPGIIGWADETNIYLQLFYVDATLTGTYTAYVVVYKDFILG